jgi:3-oxoadipate enol-lactonase
MAERNDHGSSSSIPTVSLRPGPGRGDTGLIASTRRGFVERPDCRIYYEVTGSGPALVFAHGLGSNHMTWWQQIAHFSSRYTCIAFSHRGYAPSSEIPDGPDPNAFGSDLAALIDHLRLPEVRLVAQSMGGSSAIEYMLNHPHNVQALVLASTCGTIHKPSVRLADPQQLDKWQRSAAAARADMQQHGIAPPAGERMAREQPELHFLYREISHVSSSFDREALRKRNAALSTRSPEVLRAISVPTLFITGGEDTTYPPFLSDALAALMPNARVEQVADAGHSVYFQRASIFNQLVDRFLAKARTNT